MLKDCSTCQCYIDGCRYKTICKTIMKNKNATFGGKYMKWIPKMNDWPSGKARSCKLR